MGLSFSHEKRVAGNPQSLGSLFALIGTIQFTGSYTVGGDTFDSGLSPSDRFKRVGLGLVCNLASVRGYDLEWDEVNKVVRLYNAGAELAAGAYPAALLNSGNPIPGWMAVGR